VYLTHHWLINDFVLLIPFADSDFSESEDDDVNNSDEEEVREEILSYFIST